MALFLAVLDHGLGDAERLDQVLPSLHVDGQYRLLSLSMSLRGRVAALANWFCFVTWSVDDPTKDRRRGRTYEDSVARARRTRP